MVSGNGIARRWRTLWTLWALALLTAPAAAQTPATPPPELRYQQQTLTVDGQTRTVTLPLGYMLEVLTTELEQPRIINRTADGTLYIGSQSGHVYRLSPPYQTPESLVQLDHYPHSAVPRDGQLLIAQTDGLYRAPYQAGQAAVDPNAVRRIASLPGGGGHTSRTLHLSPDGRAFVALGITGNCSDQFLGADYPFEDRRGGILVLQENGGNDPWRIYASGLRNPVGFDWHPQTGDLYASNNGPDHWGYTEPPEYFSLIAADSYHGMPWFQFVDGTLQRDDCIDTPPPLSRSAVTRPAVTFDPRSAPMGVAFVPAQAPPGYHGGDAVVALHGSWATQPPGSEDPATRREPKLTLVRFQDGQPVRVDDLLLGFQNADGARWARPVGVAADATGAIYFTSDEATSALFRLRPTR